MAIAAVRATVEDQRPHGSEMLDCVRGTLADTGKQAAFFAGDLPEDPMALIGPARDGAAKWLDADFGVMQFAPVGLSRRPGDGLAHIRAGPRRAIPDRRHAMSRGPTLFELEDSATETPATAAQPPEDGPPNRRSDACHPQLGTAAHDMAGPFGLGRGVGTSGHGPVDCGMGFSSPG